MRKGELLEKMLVLMVNAHAGQFDRGGKPYALHPLMVLNLVGNDDEELQCIALGHDIIEDTKTTYQDLVDLGMTQRIIDGIKSVTKMPGETDDEYKAKVMSNVDGMIVKKADLTHNSDIRRLKGVREKDIDRMAKYHRFYLQLEAKLEEMKK